MSTYYFIQRKDFKDTFKIFKVLLPNQEDVIHKSVGWMIRKTKRFLVREFYSFNPPSKRILTTKSKAANTNFEKLLNL